MAKIAARLASEQLAGARAVPPKRVGRREPVTPHDDSGANPRNRVSVESAGADGRDEFGWQTSDGSILASLRCGLERARTKRVSSPKEAAEVGKDLRRGDRVNRCARRGLRGNTFGSRVTAKHRRKRWAVPVTTEGALARKSVALKQGGRKASLVTRVKGDGSARKHRLLQGGWSRACGVRDTTMSIRGRCDFGKGSSSSQSAEGQHRRRESLARHSRSGRDAMHRGRSTEAGDG